MIHDRQNESLDELAPEERLANDQWPGESPGHSWLEGLQSLSGGWGWDHLAAEVSQESQARVVLTGLAGAGKHTLFDRLRGWNASWDGADTRQSDGLEDEALHEEILLEPYGSFILTSLPARLNGYSANGEETLLALGDPALVLYLVDAKAGVRPADYRWVAALRAAGRPLIVALNKIDLIDEELVSARESAERQLGMPVFCISALSGLNIEEQLLPAMLDAAPGVAIALGREVQGLRRRAARRLIRQAALFAGMVGAQPIPLLDIPLQAALQVGLIMRVGAIYGRAPSSGVSREIISTVASSLGLRYLMITVVKFVPLLGWVIGGVLSLTMTLLLGEAAIRYYEAGATIPAPDLVVRGRSWLTYKKNGAQDAFNRGRGRVRDPWSRRMRVGGPEHE